VECYYEAASPLPRLLAQALPAEQSVTSPLLPPALIVHAADDPWVPVAATERLALSPLAACQGGPWQVMITARGGHNGFHAACDPPGGLGGCWGDRLAARWLRQLVGA
jgi:predicted alpha/beta-fold hydrolase